MLGESYVALTPSSRRQQCFHSAFNKLFLSRALNVYVTFVKNNKSTRGKKEINKTRESTKALLSRKVITKIKKQTFKLLLFDSINRTYFSVPFSLFSCTKTKKGNFFRKNVYWHWLELEGNQTEDDEKCLFHDDDFTVSWRKF